MQPRDSVHHETIRLVSLNFRLRKRMATVLSIIGNLARLPPAFYIQGWIPQRNLCVMPEEETIERPHEDEGHVRARPQRRRPRGRENAGSVGRWAAQRSAISDLGCATPASPR